MCNKNIIVVLGGSFNPPTLAHRDLAIHAAEQVGIALGRPADAMLIPSSDNYVRRKMSKETVHGIVFSEQARKEMCLELLRGYGGAVDTIEFGDDGRGRTYETMRRLQDADPKSEYIFLAGADKLRIIPKWHEIEKFLYEFRIAVTTRNGRSAMSMIDAHPLLAKYKKSFVIIPELDSPYAKASSTEARRLIEEGVNLDDAAGICGYGVVKIVDRERLAGRVPDIAGTAPNRNGGTGNGK